MSVKKRSHVKRRECRGVPNRGEDEAFDTCTGVPSRCAQGVIKV